MHLPRPLLAFALATTLLVPALRATDATWTGATSSNWNDGTNWTPMNIPNGNVDTATFNASSGAANVTIAGAGVGSLFFTSDALASTLTVNVAGSFSIQGGGISNASAFTQNIVNNHTLAFYNSATAGAGIAITNNSGLGFSNFSNAGSATIANTSSGTLYFNGVSSAGYAAITNDGSVSFSSNATAGVATITNNGTLSFQTSSTAGSAAITNNGMLSFTDYANGDSATFTNGASGTIDLANTYLSNLNLGSLAGSGTILMPYYGTLTVGSLNTSTTFSGMLDDGSNGASFTKAGTGTLRLTGSNNYSGLTTVSAGTLLVNGSSGRSLGYSYEVDVAAGGKLGGTGRIDSTSVVIMAGGHLAPGGDTGPGKLYVDNSNLSLQNGAILDFRLGTTSDQLVLSGSTLYGPGAVDGVTVNLTDSGGFGAHTYILFDLTNGFTNIDPLELKLGNEIAGYTYAFNLTSTALELVVTAAAIPEPSTYAAFAGLGALGLAIVRRRRMTVAQKF